MASEEQQSTDDIRLSVADPIQLLKRLPDGPVYVLDDFRLEGTPLRWISIGTHPSCQIRIDDDAAEECHCLLLRARTRLSVKDDKLERRTMINGVPFAGEFGEVLAGNLITVGHTTFLACGEQGEAQELRIDLAEQKRRIAEIYEARDTGKAELQAGGETRTCTRDSALDYEFDPVRALRWLPDRAMFALDEYLDVSSPDKAITLGAAKSCAIVVQDPQESVSARHCELRRRDGLWEIRDCGSKNGSFLNGVPLGRNYVMLVAGSLLTVGKTRLVACGRRGEREAANITAPSPPEYLRRAAGVHGSQSEAAGRFGWPLATFHRWLKRGSGS